VPAIVSSQCEIGIAEAEAGAVVARIVAEDFLQDGHRFGKASRAEVQQREVAAVGGRPGAKRDGAPISRLGLGEGAAGRQDDPEIAIGVVTVLLRQDASVQPFSGREIARLMGLNGPLQIAHWRPSARDVRRRVSPAGAWPAP